MAARVVWLLANGLVAPDQVLGLTFTRKAAGELGERVRRRVRLLARCAAAAGRRPARAGRAGRGDAAGRPGPADDLDLQLVRRVARLRPRAAARSRPVGAAARRGGAVAARQRGRRGVGATTSTPTRRLSTVVEAVLTLSGALDEHLLDPAARARRDRGHRRGARSRRPPARRRASRTPTVRSCCGSLGERVRVLDVVADYRDRKRAARRDRLRRPGRARRPARAATCPRSARASASGSAWCCSTSTRTRRYAQLTLLGALFGGGHPVTAVGDPHQSIYGWRGASAGGLEGFPTTFPQVATTDAGARPTCTSCRPRGATTRAVLDAANHVAGAAARRGARASTCRCSRPGRVRARAACTRTSPRRSRTRRARSPSSSRERWRPARPGRERVTAAVLCRKRSQFEPLRRALRAQGLPVEVVGLGGLLSAPEVVDLVAALQAAHDPSRGDALMRLLTGARTRLGAADLHALAAWSGELAARHDVGRRLGRRADAGSAGLRRVSRRRHDDRRWSSRPTRSTSAASSTRSSDLPSRRRAGPAAAAGRSSAVGRARLAELAGLLRVLRAHTYLSVPELVAEAERLLGLDIEVAARARTSPGRAARAQLDAFRDVAVEFARSADHPTLGGFLAWLEAADTRENGLDMPVTEPDPDAVQLITVHAAKGLEWDVVAVAGLVDGGLPATPTQGKDGPQGLGVADRARLAALPAARRPPRPARRSPTPGAADPKDLEERRKRFVLDAGDHEVAEERRLAYVALTRARSDLLLTAAWWGDGTPRAQGLDLPDRARRGGAGRVGEAGSRRAEDGGDEPARGVADPDRDLAGRPVRARRRHVRGPSRRTSRRPPQRVRARPWRQPERRPTSAAGRRRPTSGGAIVRAARGRCSRSGCSPSASAPGRRRARSSCPRTCPPPRWSAWRATPTEFAQHLRRPVPAEPSAAGPSRHPVPRVGRGLVRHARRWSTSTRSRAPTTTTTGIARPGRARAARRVPGHRVGGPVAGRGRGGRRDLRRRLRAALPDRRGVPGPGRPPIGAATAASDDAARRCDRRRRVSSSSTGRPAPHRRTTRRARPASSSSPSTGSPGRAGRARRSTACGPRSATSAPA